MQLAGQGSNYMSGLIGQYQTRHYFPVFNPKMTKTQLPFLEFEPHVYGLRVDGMGGGKERIGEQNPPFP